MYKISFFTKSGARAPSKVYKLMKYQRTGGTLAGEALPFSTSYPNTCDLESAELAGLLPSLHIGWPLCLQPLAITILQYAASLAAGGYDWPWGLIESLLLLRLACCLIARLYANSSYTNTTILSYSDCKDHHLHQGSFLWNCTFPRAPPLRILQNSLIGWEKGGNHLILKKNRFFKYEREKRPNLQIVQNHHIGREKCRKLLANKINLYNSDEGEGSHGALTRTDPKTYNITNRNGKKKKQILAILQ